MCCYRVLPVSIWFSFVNGPMGGTDTFCVGGLSGNIMGNTPEVFGSVALVPNGCMEMTQSSLEFKVAPASCPFDARERKKTTFLCYFR